MFVKGDVAAVKSSVKAGVEAAEKIGKVTAHDTIPRPIRPIGDVVSIYDVDAQCSEREEAFTSQALGLLETFGIVYCIHAADAMCKAADVELVGFENTASGYISAIVEGDVALQDGSCCRCESCRRNGQGSLQLGGHRDVHILGSKRSHPSIRWKNCCLQQRNKNAKHADGNRKEVRA